MRRRSVQIIFQDMYVHTHTSVHIHMGARRDEQKKNEKMLSAITLPKPLEPYALVCVRILVYYDVLDGLVFFFCTRVINSHILRRQHNTKIA